MFAFTAFSNAVSGGLSWLIGSSVDNYELPAPPTRQRPAANPSVGKKILKCLVAGAAILTIAEQIKPKFGSPYAGPFTHEDTAEGLTGYDSAGAVFTEQIYSPSLRGLVIDQAKTVLENEQHSITRRKLASSNIQVLPDIAINFDKAHTQHITFNTFANALVKNINITLADGSPLPGWMNPTFYPDKHFANFSIPKPRNINYLSVYNNSVYVSYYDPANLPDNFYPGGKDVIFEQYDLNNASYPLKFRTDGHSSEEAGYMFMSNGVIHTVVNNNDGLNACSKIRFIPPNYKVIGYGTYQQTGCNNGIYKAAWNNSHIILANTQAGMLISIDSSNPLSPTQKGTVSMTAPNTVDLKNNIVAAVGNATLRLFQVNQPALSLSPLGSLATNVTYEVKLGNGFAYLAQSNGLQVVNITDPTQPVALGKYAFPNLYKLVIDGNFAYVNANNSQIHFVDISDPNNPSALSVLDVSFSTNSSTSGMVLHDQSLIFGGGKTVNIFNSTGGPMGLYGDLIITPPAKAQRQQYNLKLTAQSATDSSLTYVTQVSVSILAGSPPDNNFSLPVIHTTIRQPVSQFYPLVTAFADPDDTNITYRLTAYDGEAVPERFNLSAVTHQANRSFSGISTRLTLNQDGNLLSHDADGFALLDADSFSVIAWHNDPNITYVSPVSSTEVLSSKATGEIDIFKKTAGTYSQGPIIYRGPTNGTVLSLSPNAVLYMQGYNTSAGHPFINVYNLTDTSSVVQTASLVQAQVSFKMAANDQMLVNAGPNFIQFYSTSNPYQPQLQSTLSGYGSAHDIKLANNLVLMTLADTNLVILNATNLGAVVEEGRISLGEPPFQIVLHPTDRDLIFVAKESSVDIIDIKTPAYPRVISKLSITSQVSSVAVKNNTAWVTNTEGTTQEFLALANDWRISHKLKGEFVPGEEDSSHVLTLEATDPGNLSKKYNISAIISNRLPYFNVTAYNLLPDLLVWNTNQTYRQSLPSGIVIDDDGPIPIIPNLLPYMIWNASELSFSGTPPLHSQWSGRLNFTASDGHGGVLNFSIPFRNPNEAPVIRQNL
ncbi:MAG: Peptidase, partial [Gammaproteobacteria bacterium]|nr:Peptidase [Gammaproteobacteria bacterium]